ncbi:Ig-like domain-containing protein, partial [Cohnella caldifontis]|uniref:RCC1 domain-containing protein n=1 Tax=Cohnella caldifontis TaxID=3027471 RepID=UPI0023EACEC5
MWSWGSNEFGKLGDGTTTDSIIPVQAAGLKEVISIAAGYLHSAALENDGTVWTWGYIEANQDRDEAYPLISSTPVRAYTLTDVNAIASGSYHLLALKNDGSVWTWGWNAYGQLGDGDRTAGRGTPYRVQGLSGVTAVEAGEHHSLALKNDGTVWAWGGNGYGQLGDGTTEVRLAPVQVSGLNGVIAIACGAYHSIALKNDGTVWAWGRNDAGQLGDGTSSDRPTPVQVSGLSGVTAIAGGGYHTIASRNDGTVWTWGLNYYGELGDGTTTSRTNPDQVPGLSVPVPSITGITLDSSSYALVKGGTHQTVVTAHYSDQSTQTVTDLANYQSSNPDIASVNAAGLVSGVNSGLSMITVSYLGQTAAASVTVKDPSADGYLYGIILNTSTGAPAPGVTLTFRAGTNVTNGPVVATAIAADGTYHLQLQAGDYTAVITGSGYMPSTLFATVVADEINWADGTITPDPNQGTGFLYGTSLTTSTGAPAPGVTLTFRAGTNVTDGPVVATAIAADGTYNLHLPAGDYTAVITGSGYMPSTLFATVIRDQVNT